MQQKMQDWKMVYILRNFKTDSSMFHANETKDGKGTLTVKDGKDGLSCHPSFKEYCQSV